MIDDEPLYETYKPLAKVIALLPRGYDHRTKFLFNPPQILVIHPDFPPTDLSEMELSL